MGRADPLPTDLIEKERCVMEKPKKAALRSHPLIQTQKLGLSADEAAAVVPLVGYLGPAGEEGRWRVYHSLDLNQYTEVPEDGVERVEPLDPADEYGPSRVLVKTGTTVRSVAAASYPVEAGYLQGGIAGRYLPGAVNAAGGPTRYSIGTPFTTMFTPPCPTW